MRASIRGQLTFPLQQRNWERGKREERVLVHFSWRGVKERGETVSDRGQSMSATIGPTVSLFGIADEVSELQIFRTAFE